MTGRDPATVGIDTSRPHPARTYDWYLGGKDNHPVDKEMSRQMPALDPRVPVMARVNRAFTHRATRRLAHQGFDGLELADPGVQIVHPWHPELGEPVPGQDDGVIPRCAAVARKP
ncbi:SAM-dependent methyltransferase [Streptomyces collinus]|uniref:SAM-dependent methyltransferase n=1 Tax=Streptomyces collinus TaxID=42684 RepID=UPI0036B28719